MGQKVLGIGIVAITGLALTGQGKNLKSKKKKLPTGGKADYMKSLGGGGGGGGGGSRGSSSPPKKTSPKPNDSTVTTPEETSSITDTGSSDSGLDWSIQQTIANNEATQTADSSLLDLLNYGVPEEQQISTQEEALGQLEQLQEQNPNAIIEYDEQDGLELNLFPNWDAPTWFNPATAVGMQNLFEEPNYGSIGDVVSAYTEGNIEYNDAYNTLMNDFSYSGNDATEELEGIEPTQAYDWDWDIGGILQQNIADGTAFSWLNEDSIQDPTSVSVTNNVDGWLQQYTNDEEIELEETDTGSSDSGLDWSIQQTIANNEAAQEDSTPATYTLSPSSSGFGYSL
tara:strand:+ start:8897 stop:9919 length:1023 start_codon:yes stop_codon:yes gene_type:complete